MVQLSSLVAAIKYEILASKKAIEDVGVSSIPQGVALLTGLIQAALIARGVGPNGMGTYALILSVSLFIAQLSDVGIGTTAIRFAARAIALGDESQQFAVLRWAFRRRLTLSLLLSFSVAICSPYIAANLWHDNSITVLLQLSLLIAIFGSLAHVPMIYFQSRKQFRMNAVVLTAQTLISFVVILVIAWLNVWSLELIIVASIIAAAVGASVFLYTVPRRALIDLRELREILRISVGSIRGRSDSAHRDHLFQKNGIGSFASYMLVSSVVVTIILQLDVWLQGFFIARSELGIYSVAMRFTLPLVTVLYAINVALWPRVSASTSTKTTMDLLKASLPLCLVAGVFLVIYSIFFPLLMPIVFGQSYRSGVFLGQLLCLRYCIAILSLPLIAIGYNFGLIRAYVKINIIQLVAVLSINIMFLPIIGATASAAALIFSEIILLALVGALIHKEIRAANFQHSSPTV